MLSRSPAYTTATHNTENSITKHGIQNPLTFIIDPHTPRKMPPPIHTAERCYPPKLTDVPTGRQETLCFFFEILPFPYNPSSKRL